MLHANITVRSGKCAESLRSNVVTEEVCNDLTMIPELGRIKVDLMNRFREELNVDGWEKQNYSVSRSTPCARIFIDVTSIAGWKRT
jgi:hypothetical protein